MNIGMLKQDPILNIFGNFSYVDVILNMYAENNQTAHYFLIGSQFG